MGSSGKSKESSFQSLIGIKKNCDQLDPCPMLLLEPFQSLIGIKKNCDAQEKILKENLGLFQSLIGIKKNCDSQTTDFQLQTIVSIPDRD